MSTAVFPPLDDSAHDLNMFGSLDCESFCVEFKVLVSDVFLSNPFLGDLSSVTPCSGPGIATALTCGAPSIDLGGLGDSPRSRGARADGSGYSGFPHHTLWHLTNEYNLALSMSNIIGHGYHKR